MTKNTVDHTISDAEERVEVSLNEGELFTLAGVHDRNLRLLRAFLSAKISTSSEAITLSGSRQAILEARSILEELINIIRQRGSLDSDDVETVLRLLSNAEQIDERDIPSGFSKIDTPQKQIYLRSPNQEKYYQATRSNDLVFAIGPAGTGKTYLAVAMAVQALTTREVKRIVLCRPAVEAGENLGFLPGDLKEKVDPYFRPLYDALLEMLPAERLKRLIDRNTIEIAPLAYLRGRTLADAFVILDEAQNSKAEQMMMFLTRLGARSKALITGDETQIDLPNKEESGLLQAPQVLSNIPGIEFVRLDETDAVRHELVRRIILAYQDFRNHKNRDADHHHQPINE
ncbi:PhoH family protein [bacterium]|nr:PhoH family protein [bacterium]